MQSTEDALDTPDVPIEQPIDQSLCGEVSMVVMQGAGKDREHREEDKRADQGDDQ